MPEGAKDNLAPQRRQFALPSNDVGYLESINLRWETIVVGSTRWLLIHGWSVPTGYNAPTVTVAMQMVSGYPDAQLDMAYFLPSLARTDSRPIGALSNEIIEGQSFQRWSRHRTNESPWRPGEDDVATHLVLVDDWLARELQKS
jgi:hypothetical protein